MRQTHYVNDDPNCLDFAIAFTDNGTTLMYWLHFDELEIIQQPNFEGMLWLRSNYWADQTEPLEMIPRNWVVA